MPEVVLSHVTLRLAGAEVLVDVDLRVASGTLMALVGPSGSGKTSVLRLIAGLEVPDAGTVTVGSRTVGGSDGRPPGVAMLFQHDSLYDHLDVGGNLRFPLKVGREPVDVIEDVSRSAASRMGVSGLWRRRSRSLSGGERAMVAAARAVSRTRLRVLLLDEPLAHADGHLRMKFRTDLRRIHGADGLTTVIVTNDHEEAMALADVMAVIMDGRIVQVGSPGTVFEAPDSTDVAAFVGTLPMNLFPGGFRSQGSDGIVEIGRDRIRLDRLPVGVDEGSRVVVGLHAHELYVAPPGTPFDRVLHVAVGRVEDMGASRHVLFGLGNVPGGTFVLKENRPAAVRPGDRLELTWAPGRARLFRADSGMAIPM